MKWALLPVLLAVCGALSAAEPVAREEFERANVALTQAITQKGDALMALVNANNSLTEALRVDVTAVASLASELRIQLDRERQAREQLALKLETLRLAQARSDAQPRVLVNLSTRGWVGQDDAAMIGGFVITARPTRVLIRAVGPTLAQFAVADPLPNPEMVVVGTEIANDDWAGEELAAAFSQAQAFALPEGSRDAALVAEFAPGVYTVRVTGKEGATGVCLLEIYELPAFVSL